MKLAFTLVLLQTLCLQCLASPTPNPLEKRLDFSNSCAPHQPKLDTAIKTIKKMGERSSSMLRMYSKLVEKGTQGQEDLQGFYDSTSKGLKTIFGLDDSTFSDKKEYVNKVDSIKDNLQRMQDIDKNQAPVWCNTDFLKTEHNGQKYPGEPPAGKSGYWSTLHNTWVSVAPICGGPTRRGDTWHVPKDPKHVMVVCPVVFDEFDRKKEPLYVKNNVKPSSYSIESLVSETLAGVVFHEGTHTFGLSDIQAAYRYEQVKALARNSESAMKNAQSYTFFAMGMFFLESDYNVDWDQGTVGLC